MGTCHRCGRDNSELRRYCGGCGLSLSLACRGCGFANGKEDRYCGGCGKSLEEAAANPAAVSGPAETLDPNLSQLLAEVSSEKNLQEEAKKVFDQSELDSIFDAEPDGGDAPSQNP